MRRIHGRAGDSSYGPDALVDQIRRTDLNLLTALYVLIEERSVTKAAQRMLISQPAMSRMLDRLQTTFEDQLLVRTARRYEPTQRASAIHAQLQEILPRLGDLLLKREFKFDPAKITCLFRIEAGDFGATVLIPGLVSILARHAPGIQVDVVPKCIGFESLEQNNVDLVLSTGSAKEAHLRNETLFQEILVCLMRSGHPLSKRRLTLREYVSAQHILLSPLAGSQRPHVGFLAERRPSITRILERMGRRIDVRVRVPYFIPVGLIVENTDLIATLPLEIARRLKTPITRIVPAPREFQGVTYDQIWHSRSDSSAVHKWVRGLIRTLAQHVIRDLSSPYGKHEGRILGVGISKISRRRIDELGRHADG